MSLRITTRVLRFMGISTLFCLAMPATAWGQSFGVPYVARGVSCEPCGHQHCPPHYHVYVQGPPRMCWHHACPKPICDPCNLPHFGYFETCWHPWPFPADFSHCGSPPPAALVQLNPMVHPSSSLLPPITPSTPPTFVPSRPPVSPGAGGIPSTIDQILEFPPPRKIETDR